MHVQPGKFDGIFGHRAARKARFDDPYLCFFTSDIFRQLYMRRTGPFFLRFMGKDTFMISKDVSEALVSMGIIDKAPSGKRALAAVQEAYAARRVRSGIESYRFVAGRWPRRLGELEDSGLLDGRELASTRGRPYYYYEQRDGGVLLLAPER